ncbi:polysaccharide deacetylase family protein [Brevibacterium sp. XM4083]|uniref:polysaccharide deacetylase family protein n=1 Tax=Brevibacterium sp. XM4083 TaxID=2583238 RepID=UPI0011297376|nr:polysaccharide deacetylase family protein [Brevibacterium sp. XM4083]MCM1012118.1 polysaccharide deacetylase family protein [Brevibacterium sp. XM4083]
MTFPSRRRALRPLTALTAVTAALTLLSGCVVADGTRDGSSASQERQSTAEDNRQTLTSALRSYAVVDAKTTPSSDAHLFGLPGAKSLAEATEKVVLGGFESAGAFGDRKAFSPVVTDPSERWEVSKFIAPGATTAQPTASAPAPGGTGGEVDYSNRVLTAGGDYLISAVTENRAPSDPQLGAPGTATPSPSSTPSAAATTVFVTDLAKDTTVEAADLFTAKTDPGAIGADETGALTVDGEPVGTDDLTALGQTVTAALHTPVNLPQGADERDPDYSCALLPCVALTYDDGPGETSIEDKLLADAKDAKIRLTYFLLGKNVEHNPGVVGRMAEAGHELGNHSWSHPQLSKQSPDTVKKQIGDTDKAIEKAGGGKVTVMRPPYGAMSKASAKAIDHPAIMWDVDTEDWRHKSASMIVDAVRAAAKPGSVVLMHSIHPTTIDAAPEVFKTVADEGLYAVTVSDLFAPKTMESGAEYFCRGYATVLCSNPEHPAVHRN